MRRTAFAVVFAALLPFVAVQPAMAKSKTESARRAAAAAKAKLAQVTAQVQAQQARSAAAAQAASAARQRLRSAQVAEAEVEHHLAQVRASVHDIALRFYMSGISNAGTSSLAALDPAAAARADFLRSSALGLQSDVADELAATRQDLEAKRKAAESAAALAASRSHTAASALASLRASQAEQLRLVGATESSYLASLREDQLAARNTHFVRGAKISLTTVHGITVATSIADNLGRMLDAADADGYHFSGSGYRSAEGQIALRRAHCGSSSYDVYDKPASQCHPPTARPGTSMHEQGLAVDFSYNGSVINSHSNPGFQWLRGHASRYGFYNLPSEAWHWSVNGN
ncbi:MAG TPA: M15 family metallopeptidase [Acidimicrobiales bacterium]|nr:M15 family metallopeptidase [Acidimicrobiales bacterium]